MENEIWKDVPGYAGTYQVSNFGRVKSLRKVLKAGLRKGYLYISLRNKKFNIHRLVAIAFIPNPGNLPEIDHIDGNPLNNNANNLKWATRQQNELNPITRSRISKSLKGCNILWKEKISKTLKGRNGELHPRSIKVYQYSRDNVFIKSYPNAQIASKETHIPQSNINRCVNNKLKSAGGYLWKKI